MSAHLCRSAATAMPREGATLEIGALFRPMEMACTTNGSRCALINLAGSARFRGPCDGRAYPPPRVGEGRVGVALINLHWHLGSTRRWRHLQPLQTARPARHS